MKRQEVANEVWAYGQDLAKYDPADIADEEGTPLGDIRLQAFSEADWQIHTGDSQYDQDHRGHWGASYVSPNCTMKEAKGIAENLIDQVRDSMAEDRS